MHLSDLQSSLADLHLPAIRFFNSIDSTNNEAWRWVAEAAPHGALVIAEEQTAGRGRLNRTWITRPGTGLAFSLVLLAPPLGGRLLSRLTGLGALAACLAMQSEYSLPAQIKWPNDILLDERKTGGVLVEMHWHGPELQGVVIGIGINIAPESINPDFLAPQSLAFPATCIETSLGHPVDRMKLLHAILQAFFDWLPRLGSSEFIQAWEANLAYRGQWVELSTATEARPARGLNARRDAMIGKEIGLAEDGSLQLRTNTGELVSVQAGEIHLRPTFPPPAN